MFVLIGGQWLRCRSKLAWLVESYTEIELRYACEEFNKRYSVKKKDLEPERLAEWMQVRKAAIFDPRLARKVSETRLVYGPLAMTTVPSEVVTVVTEETMDLEMDTCSEAPDATAPPFRKIRKRPVPARTFIDVPSVSVRDNERSSDDDYGYL